jgi:uncharacterized LabA/DUF88 family protein
MERAAILIDGGYLDKVRLAFNKPVLDIVKFSDVICGDNCERFRTYYYDALPWIGNPPNPQDLQRRQTKQHYLDSLRMLHRVEVRLGEVQRLEVKCIKGQNHVNFIQKLVDVLLSVDIVRLAWGGFVDKIVLVSGDRDFLPAVNTAKEAGVIVKLVYATPPHAYVHTNLLMACDERQVINQELIKKATVK